MTAPTSNDPSFIAKRVSGGVNVSATHPTLGPVYWLFASGADCNSADFYSLTDDLEADSLLALPRNWRDSGLAVMHRGHMGEVWGDTGQISYNLNEFGEPLDETGVIEVDQFGEPTLDTTLHSLLKSLQERSGQTVEEFVDWMRKAVWVDVPAPQRPLYLQDINEFAGFHPIWTREVSAATTFTPAEIAIGIDSTDCHVAYAATVATFIPLSAAQ
jgi:hypothetical protein